MYPIYAEIIEKLYAPQEVAWGTLHLEAFYDAIIFANHLHLRCERAYKYQAEQMVIL